MKSDVPSKRLLLNRRLAELFLPCIIFSAVITLLNITGILVKRSQVVIVMLVCIGVFTYYNFSNLRQCYFDLRNKRIYFVFNLLAHAIFAAVNMLLYAFAPSEAYAWLFSVTKVLIFIDIDPIYSVLAFHLIEIICIFAATIGMNWIFKKKRKRR